MPFEFIFRPVFAFLLVKIVAQGEATTDGLFQSYIYIEFGEIKRKRNIVGVKTGKSPRAGY